ncbi:unnamed protein product [Brassicogethes aeneus]|uniref:Major facilitator superfamily (MFS) profile domain-containing protein n=1 Tax=Brassicogethes aeneus TaxID=1431903 RepID=A0A9P0FHS7_BRAAE|nr:unnamed protein product [Brassicogethes aeneus]
MFEDTLPQVFAVLVCTLSAISDGMQYGWSAPIIPMLKSADSPIRITETEEGYLELIYLLGGIAGLPITMLLVDRVGRKGTLVCAACSSLTGWILTAAASQVEYFYVARFCTGLAADVAFVSAPMYVAEIADKKIRGFLAGVISIMLLIGVILIYTIAPLVPIYASAIIGACVLVIQLILFNFVPESPYYLLAKNRREDAEKALRKLRSNINIEKELEEIITAVQRQRSQKSRPTDLIRVKSNRKGLIIMTVLNASQHFSSISVMIMNLHSILEAGNSVYIKPLPTGIIFSAVMLAAAIASGFLMDKFGRKILLTSSCLSAGLSLLVLAIYFTLKKSGVDVAGISWLPIVSVMVYAAVFRFGLGMVPLVLTSELFPANVKAIGMTISDAMYLIFALISVNLYHFLGKHYGLDVPFYIFAGSCLFTATFCVLYIPETKGKTLDEIQFILKGEPYPGKEMTELQKMNVPEDQTDVA